MSDIEEAEAVERWWQFAPDCPPDSRSNEVLNHTTRRAKRNPISRRLVLLCLVTSITLVITFHEHFHALSLDFCRRLLAWIEEQLFLI